MTIRKRRRSIDEPGHAHFLTFSCYQRLPFLVRDRTRQWLFDSITSSIDQFGWEIWAYVVMPEHVHLLAWPTDRDYSTSRFLAAIKRPVAVEAKAYLVENDIRWLERLTVTQGQRTTFRFWQAGGGYDRNVTEEFGVESVIDYIHANPVRRGLVERPEDYRWSTARWYADGTEVDVPVRRPRF